MTNKVEYEDKGATTTVITAALGFGDDTDEDESDAAEDTDDTQRAPKRAKRATGPFPTADDDLDEVRCKTSTAALCWTVQLYRATR